MQPQAPMFGELGSLHDTLGRFPLGKCRLSSTICTCKYGNAGLDGALMIPDMTVSKDAKLFACYALPERFKGKFHAIYDMENRVTARIDTEDLAGYVCGLGAGLQGSIVPQTGEHTFGCLASYRNKYLSSHGNWEFGNQRKSNYSALGFYKGFLLGGYLDLDFDRKHSQASICAGYHGPDSQVHLYLNKWDNYIAKFYQRITDCLEAGVMASWTPNQTNPIIPPAEGEENSAQQLKPSSETGNIVALAARYLVSPSCAIKGKITSDSEVSVGVEAKIRPGTTLSLGTKVDGKDLSTGGIKFGGSLEFTC